MEFFTRAFTSAEYQLIRSKVRFHQLGLENTYTLSGQPQCLLNWVKVVKVNDKEAYYFQVDTELLPIIKTILNSDLVRERKHSLIAGMCDQLVAFKIDGTYGQQDMVVKWKKPDSIQCYYTTHALDQNAEELEETDGYQEVRGYKHILITKIASVHVVLPDNTCLPGEQTGQPDNWVQLGSIAEWSNYYRIRPEQLDEVRGILTGTLSQTDKQAKINNLCDELVETKFGGTAQEPVVMLIWKMPGLSQDRWYAQHAFYTDETTGELLLKATEEKEPYAANHQGLMAQEPVEGQQSVQVADYSSLTNNAISLAGQASITEEDTVATESPSDALVKDSAEPVCIAHYCMSRWNNKNDRPADLTVLNDGLVILPTMALLQISGDNYKLLPEGDTLMGEGLTGLKYVTTFSNLIIKGILPGSVWDKLTANIGVFDTGDLIINIVIRVAHPEHAGYQFHTLTLRRHSDVWSCVSTGTKTSAFGVPVHLRFSDIESPLKLDTITNIVRYNQCGDGWWQLTGDQVEEEGRRCFLYEDNLRDHVVRWEPGKNMLTLARVNYTLTLTGFKHDSSSDIVFTDETRANVRAVLTRLNWIDVPDDIIDLLPN